MPFKELQERITELERKMGNLLFYGVVIEAKENKVKVAQGDLVTGWIPVFQPAAGTDESVFVPIEKGEMVCVVCPNGSIENGAAIRGMNYNGNKIPTTSDQEFVIKLKNGNTIKFDKSSNKIHISVTGDAEISAANAKITASGTAEITATGNTTIKGNNIQIDPTAVCKVGNGLGQVLTTVNALCPVFGVKPTGGSTKLFSD